MNSAFHRFVDNIVQQTDAPLDEKEDLYEELIVHLELSYAALLREGYSEQEAECKAMASFGDEKQIGSQIQQAMFPYRKQMLLALVIASLLFSFAVYISQLVVEGDALITWLLLSVSVSVCLLVFSLQPISLLNRRAWINSLLLIHLFIYLLGVGFASSVDAAIAAPLTFLAWGILLLTIALVYRTTIFDYRTRKQKLKKQVMILHALNITWGIFITSATLFFLWAFLAFSTGEFNPRILLFLLPLLIWIIAYIVQIILLSKEKKKSAYMVALLPFIVVLALLFWWFGGIIR